MSAGKCGTYPGVAAHRRAGEQLCEDCRRARREYMAGWRRSRPDLHADNVATQLARERALRRLAQEYPAELARLYGEELAAGRVRQDEAS